MILYYGIKYDVIYVSKSIKATLSLNKLNEDQFILM